MQRPLIALFVMLSGTIFACQKDAATAASASQYVGTWTGTTSQNLPITFTVSGNAITSISVNIRATMAGSSCTYVTGSDSVLAISSSAFSLPIGGGTVTTVLRGTFSSPTAASGTIDAFEISGLLCPGVLVIGTPVSQGSKTWQASKS